MRPRSIAVSTATLIAAASLTPAMASAAGTNTLYVSNTNTNCTDSGTGTLAAPFCTVQSALDAANPGDLVNIAQGNYAAATITHSGTASAPIVITGNAVAPTGLGTLIAGGAGISGLNLSGASDIQIENLRILSNPAGDSVVDGGSDVTFTRDLFAPNTTAGADALHVTGSAADVTVRDSLVEGPLVVDGGSTGTILTTNILTNTTAANPGGLTVAGATDTAVTSNSIAACGTAVSVTDSASGTRVENNVIEPLANLSCPNPAQSYAFLVDASSASGTMADYNNVYDSETGSSDYEWDATPYSTAAALYAATGQGQHDNNTLIGTESVEGSPEINSADSAAVGEQQVDYRGNPRTLDPLVTPTGAGPDADYDRGALQFEDPMTAVNRSFTASASKVPAGVPFTLNAAMSDTWSDSFTYQFTINGATVSTGTNGTYTTSISTPGTYSASVVAVPATATATPSQLLGSLTIQVAPTAPLAAKETLAADGTPRGVTASDLGTTDDWNITKVTFDFGDGTPLVSTTDGTQVQHTYATGGTYNVTETVTDASGATQSTTSPFSTTAPPAGTLTDTDIAPDGIGAYLGLLQERDRAGGRGHRLRDPGVRHPHRDLVRLLRHLRHVERVDDAQPARRHRDRREHRGHARRRLATGRGHLHRRAQAQHPPGQQHVAGRRLGHPGRIPRRHPGLDHVRAERLERNRRHHHERHCRVGSPQLHAGMVRLERELCGRDPRQRVRRLRRRAAERLCTDPPGGRRLTPAAPFRGPVSARRISERRRGRGRLNR